VEECRSESEVGEERGKGKDENEWMELLGVSRQWAESGEVR